MDGNSGRCGEIAVCALYLGPPEEELVIQLPMSTTWEMAKHALKKKLSAEKQFTKTTLSGLYCYSTEIENRLSSLQVFAARYTI